MTGASRIVLFYPRPIANGFRNYLRDCARSMGLRVRRGGSGRTRLCRALSRWSCSEYLIWLRATDISVSPRRYDEELALRWSTGAADKQQVPLSCAARNDNPKELGSYSLSFNLDLFSSRNSRSLSAVSSRRFHCS